MTIPRTIAAGERRKEGRGEYLNALYISRPTLRTSYQTSNSF